MAEGNNNEWSAADQAGLLMARNLRAGHWAIPLRTNDPDQDDELHNIIVLPRVAKLRIFDGRSSGRRPVIDALVRKITIKCEGKEHVLGVFPGDGLFINDWYPQRSEPDFAVNPPDDGHSFDKRLRSEWIQHLRVWLRMLGGYSGSISGFPSRVLQGDLAEAVIAAWSSATGRPESDYAAHQGYNQIARLLRNSARGVYLTNTDGEIHIPLPVSAPCEVTVQMRELALVDAEPYSSTIQNRRMVWHDDGWYCVPGTETRAAAHRLTETLTFQVGKDVNDHVTQAFTQVWCQPVYLEHAVGANATDKKKQIIPMPIGAAPTLMIPTVTTGSGPIYGQVGFVRTYGADQNYKAIRQHGASFYAIDAWSASSISAHATQAQAQAASNISASPPSTYRMMNGQWHVVRVDRYFGPFDSAERAKRAKYHAGHDLAGLTEDSKCFALKGGRVSWITNTTAGAGGRQIGVQSHADGVTFEHQYVHMHTIDVQKGQIVQAGQVLGTMGRTGNIDNNGATASTFPTHCHFALKRRADDGSERRQNCSGTSPGSTGFFKHKPASIGGPLEELRGVSWTDANKACVPGDHIPHLLPCGGEPNSAANFSAGTYSRWKPARCSLVPVSIRDAGGTNQERTVIRNACWARDGGICPWEDPNPGPMSRYYRYVFTGEELRLVGTSATDEQVLQSWRAYSGRASKGREVRREPGVVFDTVYYAKRFVLSAAKQAEQDVGPIPVGTYRVSTDDVIDFDDRDAISEFQRRLKYRTDNWGEYGVRLTALAPTQTHRRAGFYIHGGTSWGSAGCIDLRTQDEQFFREVFKPDPDGATMFQVTVDYGGKAYVEATDEIYDSEWEL